MQRWTKRGLVFQPDPSLFWQRSHAALPTCLHLHDDTYRVYFSSRDASNRAYVGWFDLNLHDPGHVLGVSSGPVLSPGPLGFFDDHGVQACSVVRNGGQLYLYYLGWSPGLTRPLFYAALGLSISDDGGETFVKYADAPIMERSRHDPWMVSGGTVRLEQRRWRMWYVSGMKFEITAAGPRSVYDIKYAESDDGIHWQREGVTCLPLGPGETNISRLSVIEKDGRHFGWYPMKKEGQSYRIGFAVSADGLRWDRRDEEVGLDLSTEGWDSEALDKIEVIAHKGQLYMFYNGNRFGFDGIGLAVADDTL